MEMQKLFYSLLAVGFLIALIVPLKRKRLLILLENFKDEPEESGVN
jgi:hypothetical protein